MSSLAREPNSEDRAGPVARADKDVIGPGRAVDEIPRLQAAFLPLDDQKTFTPQDKEILLGILAVVEARGLAGLEHADVDPELREGRLALEDGSRPELLVLEPPAPLSR